MCRAVLTPDRYTLSHHTHVVSVIDLFLCHFRANHVMCVEPEGLSREVGTIARSWEMGPDAATCRHPHLRPSLLSPTSRDTLNTRYKNSQSKRQFLSSHAQAADYILVDHSCGGCSLSKKGSATPVSSLVACRCLLCPFPEFPVSQSRDSETLVLACLVPAAQCLVHALRA